MNAVAASFYGLGFAITAAAIAVLLERLRKDDQ